MLGAEHPQLIHFAAIRRRVATQQGALGHCCRNESRNTAVRQQHQLLHQLVALPSDVLLHLQRVPRLFVQRKRQLRVVQTQRPVGEASSPQLLGQAVHLQDGGRHAAAGCCRRRLGCQERVQRRLRVCPRVCRVNHRLRDRVVQLNSAADDAFTEPLL